MCYYSLCAKIDFILFLCESAQLSIFSVFSLISASENDKEWKIECVCPVEL